MFAKYFSLSISNSLTDSHPQPDPRSAIWISILALHRRSITFSGSFIFPVCISLFNALFGCWEMKGKKMIFLSNGSFVAEKMKGKGRKRWFLNLFFFFFWSWQLQLFLFLRLVAEEKKKTEKKKVIFFYSLWLCLVVEKWILWRENERKEQEKWFLNFLIFVFKVWVNYINSPYPLHHISIWSITFQLCQFSP